jgi:hypothetical protein
MPEIVLEGVTNPDEVRDWLYQRMRGAKGYSKVHNADSAVESPALLVDQDEKPDEVTELLRGIRGNLSLLLEKSKTSSSDS